MARSGMWLSAGTPADFFVVQAIKEIRAPGPRVIFHPFWLMDVPAGNTPPDPYSDNAAMRGQATCPWRGRITCSPATGYAGTEDKTTGADWGYRRTVLPMPISARRPAIRSWRRPSNWPVMSPVLSVPEPPSATPQSGWNISDITIRTAGEHRFAIFFLVRAPIPT